MTNFLKTILKYSFASIWIIMSYCVNAQELQLTPLRLMPKSANLAQARVEQDEDSTRLKYPLFDDFTRAFYRQNQVPDAALWEREGGAFINNTFGINPVSFNVATLDGINTEGQPYNFMNIFAVGEADRLSSRKIDLSESSPADRLIFSFYWQAQGQGARPDPEDYIVLQFKDRNGNWIDQWRQDGRTIENTAFRYQFVVLSQSAFFHRDFQFRFQTFCRLSGAYDVWNIDYILLTNERRNDEGTILDIANSRIDTHYLKRYRAMPLEQFYANARAETEDSLFMTTNNLDRVFNIFSYDAILSELVSGERLGVLRDSSYIIGGRAALRVAVPTNRVALPQGREKMILEYKFRLNTGEQDDYIEGLNFRTNDTLVGTTVLDNYYAYDDGTPEYAVSINQRFGKLAYRFVLNKPTTLTHIDIAFVPLGTNLNGETYNLRVWKKLDFAGRGARDSVLLVQNTLLTYPDSIGKFSRIELSRRLSMSDTFYIGFEQLSEKHLTLGWDRNTDSGSEIFTNTTNEWRQNRSLKGSILLRPVFDLRNVVSSPDVRIEPLEALVYPNPSEQKVTIEGNILRAVLVDMQGRTVLEAQLERGEGRKTFDLGHLPSGIYVWLLSNEQASTSRKFILQK